MTENAFDNSRFASGDKAVIDDGRVFMIHQIDFDDRDFFVVDDNNGDRLIFHCSRVNSITN